MNDLFYVPKNLLTTNNAKTLKGKKEGWETHILYMAPYTQNSFGKNLCPMATEGCAAACLYTAGRGRMSNVQKGRTNKANYFLKGRKQFLAQLELELMKLDKKASKGKNIAVRLNGTSDLSFEKFIDFEAYPNLVFYDYTKVWTRYKKPLPKNYSLVFSRSESNEQKAIELLNKGVSVAVVFSDANLPTEWNGFKVVNGDETDLRFLDSKGVVVGLYAKGDAKKDTTGFVVQI